MAEEKDKPLDQQIKEAELAKLKAETADVEKRSKQARVMGVPIVQIIFGGIVVGFVLLNYIQPLVNLNTQNANLQTEISSKESEKGQLEDWIKRLKLDSTNIALQQLAKSLDFEKGRLASLNDSLKQETKDLEGETKEAEEKLARVETRVKDLNAQEKKLLTTIESEKVKVKISGVLGRLDSAEYAIALKQYQMIKAKNYYDSNFNPEGKGIDNQFQPQSGDSVIFDAATRLTWQRSGSGEPVLYDVAKRYIKMINEETYGGDSGWRLPTLEEAMSLMEPARGNRDLHISDQFDEQQSTIWTADKLSASSSYAWVAHFVNGSCAISEVITIYVRAVR